MAGVGRASGAGDDDRLSELDARSFAGLPACIGASSGRTVPYVYNGILSRSSWGTVRRLIPSTSRSTSPVTTRCRSC